jgi:demethoxyubiquinone hydroxylase (CLK1/Coq7/Cat5 family)
MPGSMLEVFCLTQVFERRTMDHFSHHLSLPGLHDEVRATLRTMIEDEEGHLDWIAEELEAYSRRHGEERVREVMARIEAVDAEVYDRLLESEPFRSYFGSMDRSTISGWNRTPDRTI